MLTIFNVCCFALFANDFPATVISLFRAIVSTAIPNWFCKFCLSNQYRPKICNFLMGLPRLQWTVSEFRKSKASREEIDYCLGRNSKKEKKKLLKFVT